LKWLQLVLIQITVGLSLPVSELHTIGWAYIRDLLLYK